MFDEVLKSVEKRREEVLLEVKRKKDEKKKVLEEQLKIIQTEKTEVDADVERMQHQVEVRNISKKISLYQCVLIIKLLLTWSRLINGTPFLVCRLSVQ